MSDAPLPLPAFTSWPTFPFEGELRVKPLADPVDVEPPRHGEDPAECTACRAPDSAYIWVSERWRVRALDRPTGLPTVLILESRSHLDMGDLPNLLAAELGVLTVRLERAIRSLDGVARVHVNRWGDGSAHLHVWFLARPTGRLQLRGTFLSLWDDILPRIPESQWRENLALVAAWLADFGGQALAEPPHIDWQAPAELHLPQSASADTADTADDTREDAEADGDTTKLPVSSAAESITTKLTPPIADGVTTVAGSTEGRRSGNREETVKLTTAGRPVPAGSETVNLSDVGSGETIRFPVTASSSGKPAGKPAGKSAGKPDGQPSGVQPAKDDDTPDADRSATVKFATTGGTGSGAETMVFPTGDAMEAAAQASETIKFATTDAADKGAVVDDADDDTDDDTDSNERGSGGDAIASGVTSKR